MKVAFFIILCSLNVIVVEWPGVTFSLCALMLFIICNRLVSDHKASVGEFF